MKNHYQLAETISNRDEAALKFLTDIRITYLDRPGFKLASSPRTSFSPLRKSLRPITIKTRVGSNSTLRHMSGGDRPGDDAFFTFKVWGHSHVWASPATGTDCEEDGNR